ncbi:MAG: DUF1326 domain-containing protein [Armatimonadota bacterium]|nr:DUF1326 domain-containing protein [Armatimonadota bacterium]
MKISTTGVMGALALLSAVASVQAGTKPASIEGDYIEARSASVYAGPCHYSNEVVTAGHTATLAWHFRSGEWHGSALAGLNAVAVLSADSNLGEVGTARTAVLYLDSKATPAQQAALRSLISQKYASVLGTLAAVKSAPTTLAVDGLNYRVQVGNIAQLNVNRYLCRHCTEDYQIWYQPFVAAQGVIVGKTTHTAYHDNVLNASWDESQEANSAFVGTFSL